MDKIFDTAIVGGGIAGYSAALTAKNLQLDYIWFGEEELAEKIRLAEKISNFPTVTGTGADFTAHIERQRKAESIVRTVRRIDGIFLTEEGYALTASQEIFYAKTVILATGVELRGQLVGEREFLGRGVSYCAVCDGALYRGKRIAAVLSSPKFEEEAAYLAKFAREVYCVCLYRNPSLAGENFTVTQKIPRAVEGNSRVERIVFDDETVPVDGVFLLRDSAPASALAHGVEMEGAHVRVGRDMSTNLPGLFAAGDVTGRPYQYVKAAGEGNVAAHSVRAYLREMKNRQRTS